MTLAPIPEGHEGRITPYLCVKNGAGAIAFYQRAFDATLTLRLDQPDGRLGHAELRIGDAPLMLADEFPEMGFHSPLSLGGSPVTLHLYVDDADAAVQRAVEAGATLLRPVADQFYGDRGGQLQDPYGHIWWIATRKEALSVDEIRQRAAKLFGGKRES